jgi:lipoate-protein ligase A
MTQDIKVQIKELTTQIFEALVAEGVSVEAESNRLTVTVEEELFYINVRETTKSIGYACHKTGELEVTCPSVYMRGDWICPAKRFKATTTNLLKKVVNTVKERQEAITTYTSREKAQAKEWQKHKAVLEGIREDFPLFEGNVEKHASHITLQFEQLTEEKARAILAVLQASNLFD